MGGGVGELTYYRRVKFFFTTPDFLGDPAYSGFSYTLDFYSVCTAHVASSILDIIISWRWQIVNREIGKVEGQVSYYSLLTHRLSYNQPLAKAPQKR
jgi:hypothetical protein